VTAPGPRWRRLIGVYDADGGLLGELAYLTGRLLGVARCALCALTHGPTGEKRRFREVRRSLGVPLVTLHRNEVPAELADVVRGRTPCVAAETEEGYEIVLGRGDLEACRGDVACLEAALDRAIDPA
jgi:hypothetical protein